MLEKEEKLSLKQVRLKELQHAADCLGVGSDRGAFNHLKNFADSVDEDADAGKQLSERFKEIEKEYTEKYDMVESKVSEARVGNLRVGGTPHFVYEPETKDKLYNGLIRSFNRICWQIALRHDLIPKQ